jgi:hypothetical protein
MVLSKVTQKGKKAKPLSGSVWSVTRATKLLTKQKGGCQEKPDREMWDFTAGRFCELRSSRIHEF